MSALFLTVATAAAALALDLGALYIERRQAQGAVDLAAIAAASDLDHAEAAASATLSANGLADGVIVSVTKGAYRPDAGIAVDQRFVPGLTPYNAVRVDLLKDGRIYFARAMLGSSPRIGVSAVGATASQAAFSIGSRLASVHGGLPNAVLGALLGGNVNLSAMDYEALLDASVTMQGFLDALAGELGITGGTYDDVLESDATVGNVISAAADVARSNGDAGAAAALDLLLAQSSSTSATLPLEHLIELGTLGSVAVGEASPGLGGKVNVMSLVSSAATLANGSRQVAVNLGAAVPGLLSLTLDLAIGEPQQYATWVAVGQEGSEIHTAQTRLRLVAEVGGSGVLAGARLRLPIYLDLAGARARLSEVACAAGVENLGTATIAARPSLARAWIGDVAPGGLADFGADPVVAPAGIVHTPLLAVSGSAHVEAGNMDDWDLEFTQADVDAQTIKTVETHDIAQSLVTSLVGDLNLNVQVLGLNLGLVSPVAVKSLVRTILTPVTSALDGIVAALLETLGVHLGEADIQVHGIRCGTAVLAG